MTRELGRWTPRTELEEANILKEKRIGDGNRSRARKIYRGSDTRGDSVLDIQESADNPTVQSIKQLTNINVRC